MNKAIFSLVFALLLWVSGPAAAVEFPADALAIKTARGLKHFTVEIATTREQQELGLMYRDALAPDHGMLFISPREEVTRMWMKNTRIALDMLFIDRHGKIVAIAESTTPYSTDIISSGKPVLAALEIGGGVARAEGIAVGDRVIYKAFAP